MMRLGKLDRSLVSRLQIFLAFDKRSLVDGTFFLLPGVPERDGGVVVGKAYTK
jgi:hypothetical protein